MKRSVLVGAMALAVVATGFGPRAAHAQVSAGGLNDTTMQSMLVGLGYAPTHLSKGLLIQGKRGTMTMYVQTVLSADGRKLGLNANMGLVDLDAVTAAQWKSLLALNGDIEPTMFFLDVEKKKVFLHRVLDNRSMTPEILQRELNTFMDQIQSTEKTWGAITH